MGSTDPAVRQPLLDEQLEWKKVQLFYGTAATLWTGGGAALGATGVGLVAAGAALPVGILILIAARAKYRDITIEHKLSDPPRGDFETATRPRRRSFNPAALGGSPLEQAAGRFLMAALMADARLEASIRAEERALGARIHQRDEVAVEREREARRFLRDAAILQGQIEATSINLSVSLAELRPPSITQREAELASRAAQRQPLNQVMPSQVLAFVRAAGMLDRDLAEPVARPLTDPSEGFQSVDEIRTAFSVDPGQALVPAGVRSGATARTLLAATGPIAELPGERRRLKLELAEEIAPTEQRELPAEPVSESLPPSPEWNVDIETDTDGYRWLLRRADGRVAGVSAKRFSNRAETLEAARAFVVGNPRLGVSEVSPGRFEWHARTRAGQTIAFGRVSFSTRAEADRVANEVQNNLSRARIGDQ